MLRLGEFGIPVSGGVGGGGWAEGSVTARKGLGKWDPSARAGWRNFRAFYTYRASTKTTPHRIEGLDCRKHPFLAYLGLFRVFYFEN